ncbi:MAG: sulfatase-like hydrolase/transferase [Cellvibrio sp.]|nr:sulfatase-like hydrolase/transferase [Cellvibrio sp.]
MMLLCLLILSISRAGLVIWQYDRVADTHQLMNIFLQGIRADLIMVSLWVLLPCLLIPLFKPNQWQKAWDKFTYYWACVGALLIIFMELATPSFIMQYDIRPNRLFIEYLKYPKEVFSTLWNGFRVPLILGVTLSIVLGYFAARFIRDKKPVTHTYSWRMILLTWPLVILVLFAAIRSTTQHRPANPAFFAITGDALVNSLVISSSYSVLFAIYNMKHESKSSEVYGKLDKVTTIKENLSWPWLQEYQFSNAELPTLHQQTAAIQRDKPLNLIILLQESLGATFVESLGGLSVTPELEKLKSEGWWFEQLYATGTRSVRGIEAVVSGYPPTPAQSVVKLSFSQKNFFTIAELLKNQGFHTEFIYGGEAHFDNMRSFFTGNGFQQMIDINDIKNPVFVGSWGASDEDLYNHAHQHLLELSKQNKPFFSLIFSSTNHAPFEFPDGRIDLHEQPKNTVNNAVKYADYALGEFIKKAKASPYWDKTLFLIVADHDNRVYGNNLVPVEKFHIPGLILGADIQPKIIAPIASQIDLGPTLFSLIGISGEHPMLGRDFARYPDQPGRAVMQFEDYFALMEEDKLTILKPDSTAVAATYNHIEKKVSLLNEPVKKEDKQRAVAQVLLPSILYREQQYHLSN